MRFGTEVASGQNAAGVPEGPSCQWRSSGKATGIGFEEVESVGRIAVDRTTQEGKEDEEDSYGNADERDHSEGTS